MYIISHLRANWLYPSWAGAKILRGGVVWFGALGCVACEPVSDCSSEPHGQGDCGTQTADTRQVNACEDLRGSSGSVDASTDPCAQGWNLIEGDLVVGAGNLMGVECVCEVEGTLQFEAFADLPLLERVGGLVRVGTVQDAIRFPALERAGGFWLDEESWTVGLEAPTLVEVTEQLRIEGAPLITELNFPMLTRAGEVSIVHTINLSHVDLSLLEEVDGGLYVEDLPYLETWEGLGSLQEVGSDVVLRGLPSLISSEEFHLASVGGSLIFDGCSQWVELKGFADLDSVPGDLEIIDMFRLEQVDGWQALTSIGGKMRLVGNPELARVEGFENLQEQGLTDSKKEEERWLRIAFNPKLVSLPLFSSLIRVGVVSVVANDGLASLDFSKLEEVQGGVYVRANGLTSFGGFEHLVSVSSLEITGHDLLTDMVSFDALTEVEGDLLLSDNDGLVSIGGFSGLVQLGGSLEVSEHDELMTLEGFGELEEVGGDLRVVNNPELSAQDVNDLLEQVEQVAGETSISGNGT